jgi:hypothetical protein
MNKINIEEVWKNQPEEKAALQDEEINNIRMRKSEGFLEKLQKNARIEHYMNISIFIIMTIAFLVAQRWLSALAASVLFLILIFYYHNLYKELWRLKPTADVHEFLQILTAKMKSFIQRYYLGLFFIMPLSMSFGFWLASGGEVNWHKYTSPGGIGIISLSIVLAFGLSYFLVELMYGRTYKKLKKLLAELDEQEETKE